MLKTLNIIILCVTLTFNTIATPTPQNINPTRCFYDYTSSEPVACVRQGNNLCWQELAALQARSLGAKQALQNFMGKPLPSEKVPSIGLACSGGGLRAAIATLGLLRGLEKIGLLNAVSYAAGTSGSTWTLASWQVHDTSLEELTQYLKIRVRNPLGIDNIDKESLMNALISKITLLKTFSLNDIWGALLADGFFGKKSCDHHATYLADIAPKASSGRYPIPLFTAIIGQTAPIYQWAEFSPFEIGSHYLNAWIPTPAFGKFFDSGISFDTTQPENFGYLLAIFGSIYAASITDVIDTIQIELEEKLNMHITFPSLSWLPWINNIRMPPPNICNFAYNIASCPLSDCSHLTFVDAGFDFGLPFPPLLRRNMQLYIVCDASADVLDESYNEMHDVQKYAQTYGYPFPPLDYAKLVQQKMSILCNPKNPQAPVVIYIPNFESFSTLKSSYSEEEFDRVMRGIEKAVTDNVELIKQALDALTKN